MRAVEKPLFYLDVLRAMAAIAVVVVHVLAPYRHLFGEISLNQWFVATSINAMCRWAVPAFIMMTGALFLSDPHPIQPGYFIRRRLIKVVIPFLFWSVFYAGLSGLGRDFSFNPIFALSVLKSMGEHHSWYHLEFFYYFIPLYCLVPFLKWLVQSVPMAWVRVIIAGWLLLSLSYWLRLDNALQTNVLLFGGYLVLGYYLANNDLFPYRGWVFLGGVTAILVTQAGVYWITTSQGHYGVGRFLSYKTPNVIMVATMMFLLAKYYAHRLPKWARQPVQYISRYSLGLYLLHPLVLWPVHAFHLYFGHPLFAIPVLTGMTVVLTLMLVRVLAAQTLTAWMVP